MSEFIGENKLPVKDDDKKKQKSQLERSAFKNDEATEGNESTLSTGWNSPSLKAHFHSLVGVWTALLNLIKKCSLSQF